jgi:hypothetical protein
LIFTTLMVVEWFEIRGRGICVGHNLKGNGWMEEGEANFCFYGHGEWWWCDDQPSSVQQQWKWNPPPLLFFHSAALLFLYIYTFTFAIFPISPSLNHINDEPQSWIIYILKDWIVGMEWDKKGSNGIRGLAQKCNDIYLIT